MKDLKQQRIVTTFVPIAAVLALVLGLSSLSPITALAQGYGPTTSPTMPTMGGPSVTNAGGTCAIGDSWCAYCSMNASAQCEAFVPAHDIGTTAAGARNNSGNEPVMGVDAGCGCSSAVIGTFSPLASTVMTARTLTGSAFYGFTSAMYSPGADVGGSWSWCATANMGGGAWVPGALAGTAIC